MRPRIFGEDKHFDIPSLGLKKVGGEVQVSLAVVQVEFQCRNWNVRVLPSPTSALGRQLPLA